MFMCVCVCVCSCLCVCVPVCVVRVGVILDQHLNGPIATSNMITWVRMDISDLSYFGDIEQAKKIWQLALFLHRSPN